MVAGTVENVHPIERLRYVARARGADAESLVRETAGALRGLGLDPSGLVVASRRIVERHPACGPLWWLCARLLTSTDPTATGRQVVREMEDDATADVLSGAIADGAVVVTVGYPELIGQALTRRGDVRVLAVEADHLASSFVQRLERRDVDCELVPTHAAAIAVAKADIVLVEADALDASRVVAPVGSALLAAVAMAAGTPAWLVAGRGRRLPAPMLSAMLAAMEVGDPFAAEVESLPATAFASIVGPEGRRPMSPEATRAECELAPELLRARLI